MNGGALNAMWSEAFIDELARAGVRVICIAPGSRSTPLVLAAVRDGRFRLLSVIDERSAGFVALGVGKASGRPAAVITTSGTAGANLYPAVIEASQAEVPLLVLTADRPHRLRDTDGNQSMDQLRLFGTFPRAFFEVAPPRAGDADLGHLRGLAVRAVADASGPPPGPVHVNFPFEKPLEPDTAGSDDGTEGGGGRKSEAVRGRPGAAPMVSVPAASRRLPDQEVDSLRARLSDARRGLIVAGPIPDAGTVGPAVVRLARATGFPVLADPLSGARYVDDAGAHRVARYDLILRASSARRALKPDLILRVGGSPTSAAVLAFLDDHRDVGQIVIDDGPRWRDHLASATEYLRASPEPLLADLVRDLDGPVDQGWLSEWKRAEDAARSIVAGSAQGELLEGRILEEVVNCLPAEANLLVASSMPIRDLDAFVPEGPNGLQVFGNRGVSGIDGLVSTTVGIAAAETEASAPNPTVGILGDLAFFHDLNGLQALRSSGLPVVLVVINNDGGGIFQTLPVRTHEPAFTQFFSTPHGMDFGQAAKLHGLSYERIAGPEEMAGRVAEALASDTATVLEIRTHMEATHRGRKALVEEVITAMDALFPA